MVLYLALGLTLLSTPANLDLAPGQSRILNGVQTTDCQYPSALLLQVTGDDGKPSFCSGSLVHPSIVLYAAHCGDKVSGVTLANLAVDYKADGSAASIPGSSVQIAVEPGSCKAYPGWQVHTGSDFAYCKLAKPIENMPITPIVTGCEHLALVADREVVMVGYGADENLHALNKKFINTSLQSIADQTLALGPSADGCIGDSGGPIYMQMKTGSSLLPQADNSWRQVGIISALPNGCRGTTLASLASGAIPWIEGDSGVDITPCTDADGSWNPTAACRGYPTDLAAVEGQPSTGCRFLKTVESPASVCGNGGAALQLLSPAPQSSVTSAPQVVEVWSSKTDATVEASLDGLPLAPVPGYTAPHLGVGPVSWTPGRHVLQLTSMVDNKRQTAQSIAITIAEPTAQSGSAGATSTQATAVSCQAAGTSPLAMLAALVACCRRRRQLLLRRAALGLLCAAPTFACQMFTKPVERPFNNAEETPAYTVSIDMLSQAGAAGNDGVKPSEPKLQPIPAASASLIGTLNGKQVPTDAVLVDYLSFDTTVSTLLTFTSEAQRCIQHQSGQPLKADARELRIQLFSKQGPTARSNHGVFPVVPLAELGTTQHDQYALAMFVDRPAADAAATPECSTRQAAVKAEWLRPIELGSVTIKTVLAPAGAYATGLVNLSVGGGSAEYVTGSFTAVSCSAPNLSGTIVNCL